VREGRDVYKERRIERQRTIVPHANYKLKEERVRHICMDEWRGRERFHVGAFFFSFYPFRARVATRLNARASNGGGSQEVSCATRVEG